jgi:drug/metabolite transporter (DMT)-like permease
MTWLLIAIFEPIFHGLANVLDNHLTNNLFKRVSTLMFFADLTNVLFIPIILILDFPTWPTWNQVPFFMALGLCSMGYLYPYYKALQHDDTSIVISLFSIGEIFVPILAYFLVGERLTFVQYSGFLIIIFSAALLSLNGQQKFRPNAAFFWMILCTFILALETVIYKYLFAQVSWGTGFTWGTLAAFFLSLGFFIPKTNREDILKNIKRYKKHFSLFAIEEFLTFGGSAAHTLAISMISVTLVNAVSSFQPIIVLIYALILGRLYPRIFKEQISRKAMIKKIILFIIMMLGLTIILKT